MAKLYASGLSSIEISKDLGIAKSTVLKSLKIAGVATRPSTHDRKSLKSKHRKFAIGVAPYGFARLRGKLVVDVKEVETVRKIISLWQSDMSFNAIAKQLNSQGIPTRKGGTWEHSVIKSIINRHKDNPNQIEEIITWVSKN